MPVRYSAAIATTVHTIIFLAGLFAETRQRRRGLSNTDRAKMTVLYLDEHKTLRALAADFGCATSTAATIVTTGVRLLDVNTPAPQITAPDPVDALTPQVLEELTEHGYALADGTFLHTQNAYRAGHFNHKHKQCGVVVLAFTTPSGTPFWFSAPQPGSVHDMTLLKQSGMLELLENAGIGLVADKGFQGVDPDRHLTPVKKPKGGRLTVAMTEFNYWVTRLRIPVETVFARLKRYRILVKCRRRVPHMAATFRAVLALHALDQRTW